MRAEPLTHRAFRWLSDYLAVAPLVAGVACCAAFGGFALWVTWYTGTVADAAAGRVPDIAVRAPVTLYIMIGYLPMANYYLWSWTVRHWQALAARFAVQPGNPEFPGAAANWTGATGALTMYLLFLPYADDPLLILRPMHWRADFVLPLVGLIVMGWFFFRFLFLMLWTANAISRTAQRIRHLDLLDSSQTQPYASHGVRSSLLAIVSLSISANLWLDPASPAIGTISSLFMLVVAAVLALILPTLGIHRRLKATKQAELAELRAALAARRDPTTRSVDDAQQLRADLALEQRLMSVSEWPFDAGSYGRVALYIVLGLGSWVGAALVERLLESL